MMIDQRNAGSVYTGVANNQYTLDRWVASVSQSSRMNVQQNAGSVTPPAGFNNYLGITVGTAVTSLGATDYFQMMHKIEGFNSADLNWGTANAKTVTLSFWVYSNLTGTFGGSLSNSTQNPSYVFSYTISAANTWQQVSVTVPGPVSGTWVGATNGIGIWVNFGLGTGTTYSGAAGSWTNNLYVNVTGNTNLMASTSNYWYLTGVQLEVGSTASGFDYRPYPQELALCQRYYQVVYGAAGYNGLVGRMNATAGGQGVPLNVFNKVTMRASPTGSIIGSWTTGNCSGVSITGTSQDVAFIYASATASGDAYFYPNSASNGYSLSAEL